MISKSRIGIGTPVQTRRGHPARVVCADRAGSSFSVVALVNIGGVEQVREFRADGSSPDSTALDLMPRGWVEERELAFAHLMEQVRTMVQQGGMVEGFDAGAWLERWLDHPLPALGGSRPCDLLDTEEGRRMVSEALSRLGSGAYA